MRLVIGSCAGTEARLSERLDDELHGLGRLRVARHLLACPRCRALLASLARTVAGLRNLGAGDTLPPSPVLVEAVVRRVRAEFPRGGEG